MATINDFIEIPITVKIQAISYWIAERRVLYEYPGYTPESEDDSNHIVNIQKGTIAELVTFDYLHKILYDKYSHLNQKSRWKALQNRLCLLNHIGCFDKGSDLTIRGQTIDIKVYNKPLLKEQISRYNLFIAKWNSDEILPAKFYIQAFFSQNNTIILAGYHEGLPNKITYKTHKPSYICPVKDLEPIKDLIDLLLE